MLDKNNVTIQIGDIVKIEKSPIKSDNAIYVVAQDGTSKLYSGSDLTLYKVAKHKEGYSLSKSSYNICFYPLCNFSNKYKYSREEMDTATIEILIKADNTAYNIVKSNDKYEQEETENTYFNAIIKNNDETIEDISYASSEKEKMIAFFSNITLKQGEIIEIEKQDRTWGYHWNDIKYELVSTKPINGSLSQPEKELGGLSYDIAEDVDTRDNSTIWVVKVKEKVEDFSALRAEMKKVDAYYSKFKRGFIFKYDPTEVLDGEISYTENREKEPVKAVCNTETELPKEEVKKTIEFDISEDKSPFDNKKLIYIAKVKNELSKQEFTEVKQKLAKLNGFYSSLKDGFIFKYDPKEKLII
ncbi:hypothetical protein AALB39_04295 [Lachnospiraceae bacterium 54-53]